MGSGSSGPVIKGSSKPSGTSPLESGHKGCFVCDELNHLAKEFPQYMIKPTPISVVRGRGSTIGVRGEGNRACGGGRRATQPVGDRG